MKNKLPSIGHPYTLSKEQKEYIEKVKQIVDNDESVTLYEGILGCGFMWWCRKCRLSSSIAEGEANYCLHCGRKIYDFIKEPLNEN